MMLTSARTDAEGWSHLESTLDANDLELRVGDIIAPVEVTLRYPVYIEMRIVAIYTDPDSPIEQWRDIPFLSVEDVDNIPPEQEVYPPRNWFAYNETATNFKKVQKVEKV